MEGSPVDGSSSLEPTRRRWWQRAAWVITFIVVAAGCSDPVDPGNIAAFCDLMSTGTVLTTTDADPAALAALESVAPPEVRPTIDRLRQSATRLDQLADDDLDGLFAARFNPDAVDARIQLEEYATATCGVAPGEDAVVDPEVVKELTDYLNLSAAGRPWLGSIQVLPASENGQVRSVRVVFVSEPGDGEAEEVCVNVSGWLYGTAGGTGAVTVDFQGAILAQRPNAAGTCRATGG